VSGIIRGIDVLTSGEQKNHTINLAYGKGHSLVHMAEFIAEELGIEPDMTVEPSRVGEVTHYVANIGKARAILGYDPQVPLREGIHRTVAWNLETVPNP
jgi:UDP-glucose 4-epimerase